MPDYLRGANRAFGFVVETDYNDGVTTGDDVSWLTPISTTVRQVNEVAEVKDMGVDASGLAGFRYVPASYIEGDIVFPMSFDYFGALHTAGWGSATTTGAGPYTHTRELKLDNPATLGGVEVQEDTGGTQYEMEFAGMQVPRLVYESTARGFIQVTASVFGNLDTDWASATQTAAPPTMEPGDVPLGKNVADLSWNSTTIPTKSFKLTLDRKTSPGDFVHGSTALQESHASENLEVMLEVVLTQEDYSLLTALKALTKSDAVLAATSGSQSVTWTLEDAQITGYDPAKNFGPEDVTVIFKATSGGTFGAKMVIVNDRADAVVTQNTAA